MRAAVVSEVEPGSTSEAHSGVPAGGVITMNATAAGGSRVFQAGRDVHITRE
jgi:hypothetical protein